MVSQKDPFLCCNQTAFSFGTNPNCSTTLSISGSCKSTIRHMCHNFSPSAPEFLGYDFRQILQFLTFFQYVHFGQSTPRFPIFYVTCTPSNKNLSAHFTLILSFQTANVAYSQRGLCFKLTKDSAKFIQTVFCDAVLSFVFQAPLIKMLIDYRIHSRLFLQIRLLFVLFSNFCVHFCSRMAYMIA